MFTQEKNKTMWVSKSLARKLLLEELARGGKWSNWKLDEKTNELHHQKSKYRVDLDRQKSAAAMLNWIFQIHGKTWCTAQDIWDLLAALNTLCQPQSNLCPFAMTTRPGS